MTVAEELVGALARAGSNTVFGMPGGGPNLEVIGAAEAAGMRFVLHHGETAAAITAAAYGLLTGTPAMALATRGPGAASAVNGAAQATLDRYPLLLVTDCVPTGDYDRVAHQRLDQRSMFAPVTKWSGRLGSDRTGDIASAAIALAASAPRGAVHLDFDPSGHSEPVAGPPPVDPTDRERLDHAARLISAARHPVMVIGFGAVDDQMAVRRAVEVIGCPVLTTYQAAGFLPEGHPQLAGLYTNGAIEAPLLGAADLIVTVGLDTVEPMPAPWKPAVPVVSLTTGTPASTFIPSTVHLVGPIAATLVTLATSVGHLWRADAGRAELTHVRSVLRATTRGGFGPLELAATVARLTPASATATVDAGAHFLAVMPFWPACAPLGLLISNGLATMGFAVPAAIGAALARPGSPVVCMVGDGGLGMTLAELETIVRLRLPITTVVFDDAALSLIEIKQRAGQGGNAAVRFGPIDFAAVASAMGLDAMIATSPSDVEHALADGWDRPRLIDARIDARAYPDLLAATRG